MIRGLLFTTSQQAFSRSRLIYWVLATALSVIFISAISLSVVYAAPGNRSSLEAEKAVIAGCTTKLSDSGASQGLALRFCNSLTSNPNEDPRDADGKFSIAVMPDTQVETHGFGDNRFVNRTQWLADNKDSLDLRFVGHSGDVTNWGWVVSSQLDIASNAMTKLEQADLPYALSLGNHDTRAVGHDGKPGSRGYGGSAYVNNPECVERFSVALCKTGLLQHVTTEFNAVFNKNRYTSVAGEYQVGKVDNIYSTFKAAGKDWMMLTLEMNPRADVVNWAKGVVASHPKHNVMVQTHQYLNGNGSISGDPGYGDGSNSGQYLFDNLIKQYPNIVATFSGHVGSSNIRTDTGVNGNKIVSYLQTFHSGSTNPVRLLEFNVNNNSITTSVYAPHTSETMVSSSTQSGMGFVNP